MKNRLRIRFSAAASALLLAASSTAWAGESPLFSSSFESPQLHTSEWKLDNQDTVEGSDIKVLAVTPFGFWAIYRLDRDQNARYEPDLIINGFRVPYVETHMGSYGGVTGDQGTWAGPIYYTDLEPNTSVTLAIEQPSGGSTETVSFTTRNLETRVTPDFALSSATANAMNLSDASAWVSEMNNLGSYSIDNQASFRAYPAAVYYRLTGNGLAKARELWRQAVNARAGVSGPNGSTHRWKGAYLAWATGALRNELSASEIREAGEAMIDDLEANMVPRFDDSDKVISDTRIALISGMMGVTLLPPGALRDRYQVVYDHYLRQLHGVQLAMMRVNHRFGVAGGWTLDGSGYGLGSIVYWMELIWLLEQTQPELVEKYVPYLVNAAYMQVHMVAPDRETMFSFADIEGSESFGGAMHNVPQADVRHLLSFVLQRHNRLTEANHLRALLDTYPQAEDEYSVWAALTNRNQEGPGRMKTVYVNSSGDSAGVYARTGWGTTDQAILFQFGWGGTHHGHADIGHVSWHDGGYKLRENPGYGQGPGGASSHNVPAGQRRRHSATDGGGELTFFSDSPSLLIAEIEIVNPYPRPITRRLEWNKTARQIRVIDSGEDVPASNWTSSAGVSTSQPNGDTFIYVIE